MNPGEARGWHSRGYLPHIDAGEQPVAIIFRLADALPTAVLSRMDDAIRSLPENIRLSEHRKRIDSYLDAGHGEAFLARPDLGALVEAPLLHNDGRTCRLHAWVVMPNHVHVLATPLIELARIVQGWKTFSALRIHKNLGRTGRLWQPDYFDRLMRDGTHFDRTVEYIENNPVKAGLGATPEEWLFTSARWRDRKEPGP